MPRAFSDRLLDAIREKGSPICVGIDPIISSMPSEVAANALAEPASLEASVDAVIEFSTQVLKAVAPHVPCVKFQSAYFEQFLWEGVEAYYSLVQEAHAMGLVVIGDIKRGDIGSTVSAYAAGHLGSKPINPDEITLPDAITVNPMLGLDTLEPFINTAREYDKGLFVLVRTSNPGSAALQDVQLADGRTWSEALADQLKPLADSLTGESGYSSLGAVVGATQPQTMVSLRQRLPRSIFLLPGYGAQGATAEMTRSAFTNGQGAIVSASRSILYAHKEPKYAGLPWQKAVEQAAIDMKTDIQRVLSA
jgi:orotidine-5'-phosphate decarboxylase